ncbi:MAG: 2-amino-4-hydroxy-6-hydroxymethyldihydropteridine diphosphokinase [Candidatus Eremiobacteraeota bacterium]|nr:2-amino-4-hydroxy-6-hydroxymethyldihydropteridine diphosphokinase [Candidatus Eremiobacteraeota bacterium]
MPNAYLGLCSNLGDSPGYIREALERVADVGRLLDNSDFYRSQRRATATASDSYGAVAALETDLDPQALRRALRDIEKTVAGGRSAHDGSRELTIELLLYDDLVHDDPQTRLPHPDLRTRPLLSLPLADIAPNARVGPDGATAAALADALSPDARDAVTRIAGTAHPDTPGTIDYDAPGGAGMHYDELRPLSDFNRALFDAAAHAIVLRPGMKVLDVGCGSGRYSSLFAQRGAVVTGLDRSSTMLAAARAGAKGRDLSLHYIQADANAGLPQDHFDAVTFFLSIQYLTLTPAFFASLRAALAPSGAVAVITLAHRHFIEHEVLTRYFPSIPRIDLARFPSIPRLARLFHDHGFIDVSQREVVQEIGSSGEALIKRVEGKYVSTLHLLDQAEFEQGVAAMRKELSGQGEIRRTIRATVVSAHATVTGA